MGSPRQAFTRGSRPPGRAGGCAAAEGDSPHSKMYHVRTSPDTLAAGSHPAGGGGGHVPD